MSFYELHTYVEHRTGIYGPLCEHHKDEQVAAHGHKFAIDVLEADDDYCIKCSTSRRHPRVEVSGGKLWIRRG